MPRKTGSADHRPLAVYGPFIGAPSESFIRRHMVELLPGRTAVIAERVFPPPAWELERGPGVLVRSEIPPARFYTRFGRLVLHRLGRPVREFEVCVGRFLRQNGVKVLLGEYLDWTLPFVEICRRVGADLFVHAHGYDFGQSVHDPRWAERYAAYRDAAGVIVVNGLMKAGLIDTGIPASKIHVIPYGVDVPAEPPVRPSRSAARCLAVGRMVAKKAPVLLLESFRRARQQNPGLRLDVVGDGPLLPAAKQFVAAFGLQECVVLHGAMDHQAVLRLMTEADIFLQHSITDADTGDLEGLPVAILEAMAHGLPVVATRHAGIPEAVAEGVSGYLVDEGDVAGFAERVLELSQDKKKRGTFGLAGWKVTGEKFSWERERNALIELMTLRRFDR